MADSKGKSDKDAPIGCAMGLIVIVIIGLIIWGISSCVGGDSTPAASSTSASAGPADASVGAASTGASDADATEDTASDDFLAAVRAEGAVGTDDQLRTDGLLACTALRGDVDHPAMSAIEVSTEFTQDPYNFSQHAGDEIVIDAVKYICPDLQSKVDNPTG